VGDELRRHFTVEQIVELTLDVTAWNKQKVQVALGIDTPVDPSRPAVLSFDADGRFRVARARGGPGSPRARR